VKTKTNKALDNEWEDETSYDNINKAIKLAKNIKVIDIINPTSTIVHDLVEIVSRLQNSDELEIVDMPEYTGNLYPCS
jgi:aspartate aminotransferase-like enzyme